MLIKINWFINKISTLLNGGHFSLSKKIKNSVKKAVTWISNYEYAAASMASAHHFDGVICGVFDGVGVNVVVGVTVCVGVYVGVAVGVGVDVGVAHTVDAGVFNFTTPVYGFV